jgi:hypothetical protein
MGPDQLCTAVVYVLTAADGIRQVLGPAQEPWLDAQLRKKLE